MPGLHATLGASKAKQWLSCPPSARLNQKLSERFGEQSSPFAAEGTKAHSLAELKLRHNLHEIDKDNPDGINKFVFEESLKTLGEIPSEMDRATDYYVDTVMEKFLSARSKCRDAKLLIEQRLDFSEWVPEGFGTGDAVIVSDSGLEVCDLKYGKGVPVSAVDNPQARCYGLGALYEFGELYGFREIRNTIIQPRLDSVTEETLTREQLLNWGEKIRPIAEQAWKGEGEFHYGDHCKFCNAKAICTARASKALSAIETGFDEPSVLSDEQIEGLLGYIDMLEDWAKDLKQYALNQALRGQQWKGYKLVHGRRPPRAFRNPDEAMLIMARAGLEESQYMTEPKMRTVADIEKAMGKSTFNALLGKEVVQAEGALTLVPEDDKRIGIESADAAFSDLV